MLCDGKRHGGYKRYRVFGLEKITESNNQIRIISAIADPYATLRTLHEESTDTDNQIVLLWDVFKDFIHKDKTVVDINTMLSYFRSQLITSDMPTILSNTCNAGFIYNMIGQKNMGILYMPSPTINNIIEPSDFIKIC